MGMFDGCDDLYTFEKRRTKFKHGKNFINLNPCQKCINNLCSRHPNRIKDNYGKYGYDTEHTYDVYPNGEIKKIKKFRTWNH